MAAERESDEVRYAATQRCGDAETQKKPRRLKAEGERQRCAGANTQRHSETISRRLKSDCRTCGRCPEPERPPEGSRKSHRTPLCGMPLGLSSAPNARAGAYRREPHEVSLGLAGGVSGLLAQGVPRAQQGAEALRHQEALPGEAVRGLRRLDVERGKGVASVKCTLAGLAVSRDGWVLPTPLGSTSQPPDF